MDGRPNQAEQLPPLGVRWLVFAIAAIMASLCVYWTVQSIRAREIRVPIRGGRGRVIVFKRGQNPIAYPLLVALYVVTTTLAVALVVVLAITGKMFG